MDRPLIQSTIGPDKVLRGSCVSCGALWRYKRNDKIVLTAAVQFLAHLFNQKVRCCALEA